MMRKRPYYASIFSVAVWSYARGARDCGAAFWPALGMGVVWALVLVAVLVIGDELFFHPFKARRPPAETP